MSRVGLHLNNVRRLVGGPPGERSAVRRRYGFDVAGFISPTIESNVDGLRFLVRTTDRSLGRQTFSRGAYELGVMSAAMSFIESPIAGRVFVDVGANIGTTSIPAILRFGASRALAIEPEPENRRLLLCNAILNGVDARLSVVGAAVSTIAGHLTLELSDHNSGDHRVRISGTDGDFGEAERSTIEVPSRRLDDLVREAGVDPHSIGVIWIDTQGFEGEVLSSAGELLSLAPVIAEYWPYGLRRSGGLEMFELLVRSNFSRVIDVRTGKVRRGNEIDELRHEYLGHGYTDLLLLA